MLIPYIRGWISKFAVLFAIHLMLCLVFNILILCKHTIHYILYSHIIHTICRVCNVVNANDPLLSVQIPDITPYDILNKNTSTNTNASASANVENSPATMSEHEHDEMVIQNQNQQEFPKFSFQAGDFNQLYSGPSNKSQWDSIVTCFFIDTAPVIIE